MCTGAGLYAAAGLLEGKATTTHWAFRDNLRAMGVEVVGDRVVWQGNHVTVGEPVEIGGLVVASGDLLHADQHGVLKIPLEIAQELPAAADRVIETEQALLRWVRSDEFDPDRLAQARARH